MLPTLTSVPLALVVDIGGYTMDYIRIKRGRSDLASCDSMENGVIMLYNKSVLRLRRLYPVVLPMPQALQHRSQPLWNRGKLLWEMMR